MSGDADWRSCLDTRRPTLDTRKLASFMKMSGHRAPLNPPALASLVAGVSTGVLAYAAYVIYIDRSGLAEIRQVLTDFGVPAHMLKRWPFGRVAASQEPL